MNATTPIANRRCPRCRSLDTYVVEHPSHPTIHRCLHCGERWNPLNQQPNFPLETRRVSIRRAFTLIELIVVVIVAGILLAVTLTAIKYHIDQAKVREGSRLVQAQLLAAKARAASTGRPAGVWLQLEPIGNPAAPSGYQCTALYAAEVSAPYAGDIQDATCQVWGGPAPWPLNLANANSLYTLVADDEVFLIRFDYKGRWYQARRRTGTIFGYEILNGPKPPLVANPGPDGRNGVAGVDDDGNGFVDGVDLDGDGDIDIPDQAELAWPGSDDVPLWWKYQIQRQPRRAGQPLELPQGTVIDCTVSGLGTTGTELNLARDHVLILFGQTSVAVSYDQAPPDTGSSKLHLLVGRTEQVAQPAGNNLQNGESLWVTVNRRTGAVGTVENTPDHNLAYGTAAYLQAAREFATAGETMP